MKMEAEVGVTLSRAKDTRSHRRMEDAGRILPQSLRRDRGGFTHTLTSDFWPPTLGRNKFLLF